MKRFARPVAAEDDLFIREIGQARIQRLLGIGGSARIQAGAKHFRASS